MKTGIPKQFQLAGHTVKVRIVSPAQWKRNSAKYKDVAEYKDAIGIFLPDKYEIHILSTTSGTHRQQTFAHELVHAMLMVGGHEDISQNEDFVDRMGHLLHQALTTFA